jgi:4-hydroxybenzoate polyprenyltransferase
VKPLFRYLIFGNFFIALCAVFYTRGMSLAMGEIPNPWVQVFVFMATLFVYNLQRIYLVKKPEGLKAYQDRHRWIFENRRILSGITILSGVGALISAFMLSIYAWLVIPLVGTVSLLYFFPYGGLRKLPLLKPFLIALTWAGSCVLLPAFDHYPLQDPGRSLMLFFSGFFFVFALAVIFDIRDIRWDIQKNIKTFPIVFGIRGTRWIAVFFLALSTLVEVLIPVSGMILFSIPVFLLASALVLLAHPRSGENYFLYAVDGLLLLKGLAGIVVFQNSIL